MAAKLREVIGALRGRSGKVPRQLRPEGRLQRQILARHRHAGIGQQAAGQGDMVVERLQPRRVRSSLGCRLRRPRAPAARNGDRPSRTHCWSAHRARPSAARACDTAKSPALAIRLILPLQQPLAGRLRQKGEGLGQHERERRGQQAVVHADDASGVGYSLMPSIAPTRVAVGSAVFDRLASRRAAAWWRAPALSGPRGSGTRLPFAIDQAAPEIRAARSTRRAPTR